MVLPVYTAEFSVKLPEASALNTCSNVATSTISFSRFYRTLNRLVKKEENLLVFPTSESKQIIMINVN